MLQGEWDAERCLLRKPEFFEQHDVVIEERQRVEEIDTNASTVTTAEGDVLGYEWLVIATGSELNRLDLPGADLEGIGYLRTLNDALALQPRLRPGRAMAVIGGGYIGLEVAASARKAGVEVTVIEALDGLMKRSALADIASYLQQRHEREGVDVRLNTAVTGFEGDSCLESVMLEDGTWVECDTAVIGIGVRPAVSWLDDSPVACRRGVLVDERCRTNVENVFAAGDCTEHRHVNYPDRQVLESVQNAIGQGRIVAAQITGTDKSYDEVPWFWSEQYDCRLQMAGLPGSEDLVVRRGEPDTDHFSLFTLDGGTVSGVQAINAPKDFMAGKMMIGKRTVVDPSALADTTIDVKELM